MVIVLEVMVFSGSSGVVIEIVVIVLEVTVVVAVVVL